MNLSGCSLLLIAVITIMTISSGAEAGWTVNGAPVCTYGGVQDQIVICPDDMGGSIIVWRDRRSTANIYPQRLDHMGRRQWAEGGVLVCGAANVQELPQVIADGSGGAYIVWQDLRGGLDYDIYAQRIDGDGNPQWTPDGVVICDAIDFQSSPVLCRDGAGGFVVAWEDGRWGTSSDVYAQRVDSGGGSLLAEDGVGICTETGDQIRIDLVTDGGSGAYIVWQDQRSNFRIYAQRMYSNGTTAFAPDGIGIFTGTYDQFSPKAAEDGAGGVYVVMYDANYRGYVQRFGADGLMKFGASGTLLGYNSPWYSSPVIEKDGIGGALVAWQSWRTDGTTRYDAYAQRVDRTGTLLWGLDGIPVCTSGSSVYHLNLISDGSRGLILAWRDTRNIVTQSNDIYIQRVDSLGTPRWTADGEPICALEENQTIPVMTTDGAGGAIVAWQDNRNSDNDLYAMRILSEGDYVATAVASFSALPSAGGIRIDWTMSCVDEGVSFRILRSSSGPDAAPAGFEQLAVIPALRTELRYSFFDQEAEPAMEYIYQVQMTGGTDAPGEDFRTLFETGPVGLPQAALSLAQNVPNPFNPVTLISFFLPSKVEVRLDIFDVSGRFVANLVDEVRGPGESGVFWNGMNSGGENVSSGIYFCRLTAGKETLSRKMILLR